MLKTLAKSIREYKLASILSPLFVSFEVILECLMPFVISMLVEVIESSTPTMAEIWKYAGILVAIAVASLVTGTLAGAFCARASTGFAKNLRKDLYYHIQDFSFENIDKFSTPSLVTRMTTDVTNVQLSYMMIVRLAIRAPLMVIFSFVMAFVMGGDLAWIFLAVVPLVAFALFAIMYKVMPTFRRLFHKYDDMNESIQENVSGIRVVKAYVREEYEKQKFGKTSTALMKDFTKAERLLAWNDPIMQFAFYGVLSAVLFVGSYLIMSVGEPMYNVARVSQLIVYGMQILSSVMMFSMVFAMIAMSGESARRIVEILVEKSTLHDPENPVYEVKDGSIDFDNVNFKYSPTAEKNVLEGIDLHIKSGETIGIIGGTGSSKTSLVNLLSRLYDVTEGSVKVGGLDVREYDLTALRNQVAVVLQKNVLFSGTIKENLRWGNPDATDEELVEACRLAQADDFIQSFPDKYDTYIEQGGTNVSGGQKQRLCIARALLKKPKILVLDDSTSAVDTHTDALIRKAFREYIPTTTKIIIAQRISSVEDADRIVVMDGGKINAVGTHEELVKSNPIYAEVYHSQIKGAGNEN
ncbi:MAG TPA: ABC transporter ATP-binding protein/permease [Candidatus Gallimonas intestinavium]|uniref:ABC transporter ATP-binding protein/permease n=1 Tax=Candidatus Gallimonas intestinavium TaxID=2838603 RepID=A0A9D2G4L7_9FIRM|nr:ABC transporter ATP-binding protein/permease [Candidatus Gallimonas intestinavium]